MKRTLLIALAASMALGASAAVPAKASAQPNKHMRENAPTRALTRATDMPHKVYLDAPEGDSKLYSAKYSGMFISFETISLEQDDNAGKVVEIVYCDNGDVYMRNAMSTESTAINTFIKGRKDGDKLVFASPQCIGGYNDEDEDWDDEDWDEFDRPTRSDDDEWTYGPDGVYMYMGVMKYDPSLGEDYAYTLDKNIKEFSFKIEGDKLKLEVPEGYALGECYEDGSWLGISMDSDELTLFTETTIDELPAGLTAERWVLSGEADARFVDVAIDGSTIWIGNLDTELPGYIKGSIDGTKVTLPSNQYIGINTTYNFFTYAVAGRLEQYTENGQTYYDYGRTDNLSFYYDAEAKTLTGDENEGLFINLGTADFIYYTNIYAPANLKWADPNVKPARPRNPIITYVVLDGPFGNQIDFDLPKTDINGNLLDVNRMYYNFFQDEEVFTFYPDEYFTIFEEMTDMPYIFSDFMNFYIMGGENPAHSLLFFFEGAESIGLQLFYETEDGEVLASDYVGYNLAAINEIGAEKELTSSVCYDFNGCVIAEPAHGIFIRVNNYADGSRKALKVVK